AAGLLAAGALGSTALLALASSGAAFAGSGRASTGSAAAANASQTAETIVADWRREIAAAGGSTVTANFMFALNDAMGKWLVASFSVGQVVLIR
ncbi:hypothetical protein EN868_32805, partial [Mesorhizobium sp. M2D.F.Ca.ET.225.01.1.1]